MKFELRSLFIYPIHSLNLPAPRAVIELIKCGWKNAAKVNIAVVKMLYLHLYARVMGIIVRI